MGHHQIGKQTNMIYCAEIQTDTASFVHTKDSHTLLRALFPRARLYPLLLDTPDLRNFRKQVFTPFTSRLAPELGDRETQELLYTLRISRQLL